MDGNNNRNTNNTSITVANSPLRHSAPANIPRRNLNLNDNVPDFEVRRPAPPSTRHYSTLDEFRRSDFYDSSLPNDFQPGGVYGKYTPLFTGLIVIGPGKVTLGITLFFFSCVIAVMSFQ